MCQLLTVASATRFDLFEEIITLVVYQDECREVFYFNLPDSFHTQFRIFYTFNALDIVLSQDGSRTTDRTQIETTVFLAGICYSLATVTFSQHNHRTTVTLEQVYIRVHTTGSSRAHRTTSHTLRSLSRTSIINRMILDILRQVFTTIQTFFQFGMCNVTTYDDSTVQRQTSSYRIFILLTEALIREIRREIDPDRQSVVSVAAGVSLAQLAEWMTADSAVRPALFRVIPNTAIAVRQSMTFVAARGADEACTERVLGIFRELGEAMLVDEPMLETGMILASCGIAFALRYVRASVEGGVELGCPAGQATHIVAATLRGAAELLLQRGEHPETEIDRVTTPGGITVRGLNEMEQAGFSAAVIRGLKACK